VHIDFAYGQGETNMSSKMTPGPWHSGEGGTLSRLNVFSEAIHRQVANAQRFVALNAIAQVALDEESEANAKAIAALPELIEALQHARYLLSGLDTEGSITMTPEGKDAIMKQINEALRKAGVIKRREGWVTTVDGPYWEEK
jgi:hypothetical protein